MAERGHWVYQTKRVCDREGTDLCGQDLCCDGNRDPSQEDLVCVSGETCRVSSRREFSEDGIQGSFPGGGIV